MSSVFSDIPALLSGLPAILALADGSIFEGFSVGIAGAVAGEVVFNTAMTGYQEVLTDPSYSCQLVAFTYPHIGNVGVNSEDIESYKVHAAGLIIRDLPRQFASFRATQSLSDYLHQTNTVAIAGIDTRRLTHLLRDKGAQGGAIVACTNTMKHARRYALDLATAFPGLCGMDLAQIVSTTAPYIWTETEWRLGRGYGQQTAPKYHVVVFDYGVKYNILRMLAQRGCKITVLPAQASAADVLALQPDGIFLSNGPGDPASCVYAIETVKTLIDCGIPTFGICLGHQIMALASGAKTVKMKFGHHGANHPVQELQTKRVFITAQNHGFVVDKESLPSYCKVTHLSLFDGTLQGFERTDHPAFCFQGHPEASPGPHDVAGLFDKFVEMMHYA